MFPSIDCSEFYQQNIPSLYLSANTDKTISSIYTEEIKWGKKE